MMLRKGSLLVLTLLLTRTLCAQVVSNVDAYQDGTDIVISYELDSKTNTKAFYSLDGGKTFLGPLLSVVGDIGECAHVGLNKFRWDVLSDLSNFSSNEVVFKIIADNNKGVLIVKSTPRKADVTLNKTKYLGTTPIEISLPEGHYDLFTYKGGWNGKKEVVKIQRDQTSKLKVKLNKRKDFSRKYNNGTNNGLSRFWNRYGFNLGAGAVVGYDAEYGVATGAGLYWRLFRHNSIFNFNLGCEYTYYSKGGATFQFPLLINWNMFSMFGDCSSEAACGYIGFGITPMSKYGICPYNIQVAVCMRHWDFKLNAIVSDHQVQMSLGTAYYF